MASNSKTIKILSASSVARLPYDMQQTYFQDLINNMDSDEDYISAEANAQNVTDWGDETMILAEVDGEASDVELDSHPVELGHGGDSQNESDFGEEAEEEETVLGVPDTEGEAYFYGKDGTKWNKTRRGLERIRQQNIFREPRYVGPSPTTRNLSDVDTFFALMHPTILSIICRNTNKKGKSEYEKLELARSARTSDKSSRKYIWEDVTEEELGAYFGILLVMGSHNANNEKLDSLWQKNAFPLYRATMSAKRFSNISRFIRFDQQNTREIRASTDKAAPVSEIFEMLNANLRGNYRPGEHITVDEQLFAFRGRTKFTQYIPSKPAKYGIKLWWVCDAKSYYPLTGQIYTGKTNGIRDTNQGERVVKELVEQYKNTGRNITCDNFFTSLSLANTLKSWRLSLVGTLKKNKPYLPKEFKASPERKELSAVFGYGENINICSYVPKKNKAVVFLSTLPCDDTISDMKQKPNVILFYNATKGGVDVMDHMLGQYTTKRKTNRWPLAFFYNMLDLSALAAYIIYSENIPSHITSKKGGRRLFLQQLGEHLCMPMILKRSQIPRVISYFSTRNAIECILGSSIESMSTSKADNFVADEDDRGRSKVKGACYMCYHEESKRKRSTRKICIQCKKPVCAEHSQVQTKCNSCFNN